MLNMLDAEAQRDADRRRADPGRSASASIASRRASMVVERLEAEGVARRQRRGSRTIQTPYRRSLGRGDRAVADRPMVCRRQDARRAGDRGGARRARSRSCPKTWEKTCFNWLENIQPWCVSRQLWWGHRIPAWYDEDGNVYRRRRPRKRRSDRRLAPGTLAARRDDRRARHLVLLRAVAVRARSAGRTSIRASSTAATPTTCSSPASTSCSSGMRA